MNSPPANTLPTAAEPVPALAPKKLVNLADVAGLMYRILPLRLLWYLARLHSRALCLFQKKAWQTVRDNLEAVFGKERDAQAIATMTREFFESQQVRLLLAVLAPRIKAYTLENLMVVEGLEHLDRALERGKGVILLCSHLNSLSGLVAIILLRQRGYDIRVAVPSARESWEPTVVGSVLNRWDGTKRLSELMGAFYCQFNIRPIVRCLTENRIVAQTGDGWHSAAFVEAEFLGRSLPFTTGSMSIAQETGAAVVPLFVTGTPPDKMRVILEEPILVERGAEPEGVLRDRVAYYVKRLEHYVLENGSCWQHWHVENTLETMATWPQRLLKERYAVGTISTTPGG